MPVVNIPIGHRSFELVCGEGQEENLQSLAVEVSARLMKLSEQIDTTNDTLLLVMTALMLQDELNELKSNGNAPSSEDQDRAVNESVSEAILAISEYVDAVKDRIEKM